MASSLRAIPAAARLPSATASTTSRPPFTQSPPAKYRGLLVWPVDPLNLCRWAHVAQVRDAGREPQGPSCSRGVRIASEQVHKAGARILQHEVPGGCPGDEVCRPLDQRPARGQLAQAFLQVRCGVTLGVGDDRVYATRWHAVDECDEVIAKRSGGRLNKNPTATTERQSAKLGVTESCSCRLSDLRSG